ATRPTASRRGYAEDASAKSAHGSKPVAMRGRRTLSRSAGKVDSTDRALARLEPGGLQMQVRNSGWIVALLVWVLVAVPPALAVSTYGNTFEHDDIGRSSEPDFLSTSVLGATVTSCNVDQNRDGQCEVLSSVLPNPNSGATVIAPGCTNDAGRQPSGT